jgi:hypothetical protein
MECTSLARVLKPPTPIAFNEGERSVFLAGSIELGQAEDWQSTIEHALSDLPIAILNPRRDAWDASWEQTFENPMFRGQVEWELEGLERATLIAMYFAPTSKAPITLLEFGLHARSRRAIVCCPKGYWRRGNVQVVCARYGVRVVEDLDQLSLAIREELSV